MIEIEYIVKDRNGVERLRTQDKRAADAYDRLLDNADRLARMLRDDGVLPELADTDLEELTIYLARNARNVERVLRGKEPEATEGAETAAMGTESADDADLSSDLGNVTALKAAR